MILTRTWLNEFIELENKNLNDITNALNSIGIEVDSARSLRVADKVVVGFVKEKIKHENSDKLNICKVDIGDRDLQIICGASNVDEGQFVAVALEGAMIGDICIKRTKIRGVVSEGMICSSTELNLAKINDGIMVLDDSIGELELGKELNSYAIFNDDFLEVELTPNRGDCLSIYGIARDLAVFFNENIKKVKFTEPDNTIGIGRVLRLSSDKDLNSIFNFRVVELKGKIELSLLLKLRLATINALKDNVVLNYLTYATHSVGVIFNAYDFKTLEPNEEEISLKISKQEHGETVISCKDRVISVAGISQESFAKINDDTSMIIIEAQYSFPDVISNAKNYYKNHDNDMLYRSFRGSETDLDLGVKYLLSVMSKCPDFYIYTSSQHIPFSKEQTEIKINIEKINKLIGSDIDKNDIVNILKRLGFEMVLSAEGHSFSVKVPYYRHHDIKNLADICEEIMRMIGINNIKSKPLEFAEKININNTYKTYKKLLSLRQKAVHNGYFETVHYVLDSKEELEELGFETVKLELVNPITKELNSLRTTLINHLLHSASYNTSNSKKSIKLFESGSSFDAHANEFSKIAFLSSGYKEEAKISNKAKPDLIDFYTFLTDIQNIIGNFDLKLSSFGFLSPYEQAFIYKNNVKIGFIGRLHIKIEDKRSLLKTYVCELDLSALKDEEKIAKPYSKFSAISRDISLLVPKDFGYERIKNCIQDLKIDILSDFRLIDLYHDESLKEFYSLTINFTFQNLDKTLEDSEVAVVMDRIITSLKDNLNLDLR